MNTSWKGWLALGATILLFSTFEVCSKLLSPVMQPLQISFWRFLIGALVLLPPALWQLRKQGLKIRLPHLAAAAFLGLLNVVISMGLIQWGLVYADASLSAVLFSSNPIFVALFALPFLGEKLTLQKSLGLLLGLAGVLILFADRLGASLTSGSLLGPILVALSAVFFALYTVLGKKIIAWSGLGSLSMTTFSFLAGSLMLLPMMGALEVPLFLDVSSVIPQLLWMSLFVTGAAYVLYFEGLSRLEAGAGSLLYFAKPPLASILAAVLLHETLKFNLILSIAVIGAGLFLVSRRPNSKPAQ